MKSWLVVRIATAISTLAAAVWLGGILVLGAIVAPIVFHEVPAPTSADAMTHVFLRFDRLVRTPVGDDDDVFHTPDCNRCGRVWLG